MHRHPASMRYEHGSTADGRLVYVKADIVLDGGAYASSSPAVAANAATLGVGPYEVPHVAMDGYAVYTNNPPCGAMRGFGAVQACFAYESPDGQAGRRAGPGPGRAPDPQRDAGGIGDADRPGGGLGRPRWPRS